MNDNKCDDGAERFLTGRLARAVAAICEDATPQLALERALVRARSLEPRPREGNESAGRLQTWRNRVAGLLDELEDRDLLTAVPVWCATPTDAPAHTIECGPGRVAGRRATPAALSPVTADASQDTWYEAVAGMWSEEEELSACAVGNDWVATSTACADWTWSGG